MRAADIAMYRAKSSGGGQHCLFNAELAAEHQQKVDTEKALTEAVQRGEFVLAFQPQMSLVTGEVAGAEALLRWNHPRDGLRLPGTFIPIAERTGVIAEIGDWVIGEVAVDARRLASRRLRRPARVQHQPAPGRPRRFLRHGCARPSPTPSVPLSLIELEFTESAAMEVSEPVLDEIAALRADGARIAIDDFGTGYSNLARLRAMPLDRVKLDPSLIADIETSREGAGHRPGGDPADQGRRLRGRRRGGRDRRPGRHPARHGLRHRPGLSSSPSRCSRRSSSPGPATPTAARKSVA